MTLEERLAEWLKQPGTVVTPDEWRFIAKMRECAADGVGYGWMQQIIEWEWQSKDPKAAWGPEKFEKELLDAVRGRRDKPMRREYRANGTYWSGVPTVEMPCDICTKPFIEHDPRTHACPDAGAGEQKQSDASHEPECSTPEDEMGPSRDGR